MDRHIKKNSQSVIIAASCSPMQSSSSTSVPVITRHKPNAVRKQILCEPISFLFTHHSSEFLLNTPMLPYRRLNTSNTKPSETVADAGKYGSTTFVHDFSPNDLVDMKKPKQNGKTIVRKVPIQHRERSSVRMAPVVKSTRSQELRVAFARKRNADVNDSKLYEHGFLAPNSILKRNTRKFKRDNQFVSHIGKSSTGTAHKFSASLNKLHCGENEITKQLEAEKNANNGAEEPKKEAENVIQLLPEKSDKSMSPVPARRRSKTLNLKFTGTDVGLCEDEEETASMVPASVIGLERVVSHESFSDETTNTKSPLRTPAEIGDDDSSSNSEREDRSEPISIIQAPALDPNKGSATKENPVAPPRSSSVLTTKSLSIENPMSPVGYSDDQFETNSESESDLPDVSSISHATTLRSDIDSASSSTVAPTPLPRRRHSELVDANAISVTSVAIKQDAVADRAQQSACFSKNITGAAGTAGRPASSVLLSPTLQGGRRAKSRSMSLGDVGLSPGVSSRLSASFSGGRRSLIMSAPLSSFEASTDSADDVGLSSAGVASTADDSEILMIKQEFSGDEDEASDVSSVSPTDIRLCD